MISLLFVLGVLSLLIGLSVWALLRADRELLEESAPVVRYQAPEPPAPTVAPRPVPMVTIRFLNERGRSLGTLEIPASRRKPMLVLEKLGARHVCQASHREADGTWIYRRSGRE